MIEPIAKTLCVAKSNIVANTIFFNDDGNYSGFDRNEPTSKDMGKPKAIQQIKDQYGYQTIVMVGDGATDAQAKPPADAFIGFGGVIVREAVKKKACWYVMDFDIMIEVLQKFGRRKLN
jgi:phosphoserine phosphatase